MSLSRLLLACILAVIVAAPLSAQSQQPEGELSLRAGDIIRVTVWREQDLSGEFLVDRNGVVILPLLGAHKVAGVGIDALRDTLLAGYRAQLKNPSISITPLRRINVLGEVRNPQVYLVDPTVSLAGAIAIAGGVTPMGDLTRIRIIREGRIIGERFSAEKTLQMVDVQSGDEIFVGQRNWLARNSTYVVSTGISLSLWLVSILLR